jgi:phosphoribosylformylglycinamidine synthase
MRRVVKFAQEGGLVLGICNGFQILLESGLLPGAMLRNQSLRFVCKYVYIRTEATATPFTNLCKENQVLKIPVAHSDGNYFVQEPELKRLKEKNQIIFRYCHPSGNLDPVYNPNGALDYIAGICNEKRNVLGMMPHPERASEEVLGSKDGEFIFGSIVNFLRKEKRI